MMLAAAALGVVLTAATAAPKPPLVRDPGRDPSNQGYQVLARRCLSCHGASRTGGLDLRTRESALKSTAKGAVLTPGQPEKSRLYLLAAGHGTPRMPPGAHLPAAEVQALKQWIAAGAPWPTTVADAQWWSLRSLREPSPPRVRDQAWVRNPIDAFILARLEARGLRPTPPADRATLIRRITYDLTGLPPTPAETEQFLREGRAEDAVRSGQEKAIPVKAYGRLVDRLLASPRYGERWGRHWLDVARFAESQGYERDKIRDHAWRYRDYVIEAFNKDKPYDQFVREQIAGDALPGATAETITATGFLVAGPWDEVGHSQASAVGRAQAREEELEEMVGAVSQTFLGLTVNCARCHDHKFDPIPQADYFRFQACLAGVKAGDRKLIAPNQSAPREARIRDLRQRVASTQERLAILRDQARSRLTATPTAPREAANGIPAPLAAWRFEGDGRDEQGKLHLTLKNGATISGGRLRLDGVDDLAYSPPLGKSLRAKTLEVWVTLPTLDQRGGSALTLQSPDGSAFDGVVYGERVPRRWMPGSEGFVRTRDLSGPDEASGPDRPVHMVISYGEDGRISLFRNGEPYGETYDARAAGSPKALGPDAQVLFGLRHGSVAGTVGPGGARWLRGDLEEARVYDHALSPAAVKASFQAGPSTFTEAQLLAILTPAERAERERLTQERTLHEAELRELESPPLAYAVNSQKAPVVRLLERGDVGKPGAVIVPATLTSVSQLSADLRLTSDATDGERRSALAAWLTDRSNPLPARVMVNRVWQWHFGRGLVGTPSDFGVNGEKPTHPELLDFLAARFAAPTSAGGLGWSLKRLHRMIVLSSAYQQASARNPRAEAVDADNALLWRFPLRRLEAEALRDAILAVSGQLNVPEGKADQGPGFRPFRIEISNSHFYHPEDRDGPEYRRRSVFRCVVNSGGIALLEQFDCPDPSVKTPRRGVTLTPIQALALLNNSFVLRQAQALASRLEREAGPDAERQVALAYRLAFNRPPTEEELRRDEAFIRQHGLAAFARVLFNASEFVYLR